MLTSSHLFAGAHADADAQHFDENPYFTNKTLSKKYSLPEGVAAGPTDGSISDAQLEFDDEDLIAGATAIEWKADHDLTAKHPRGEPAADADDFEGDPGSFFHYFTLEGDADQIGTVVQDILTDPLEAFEGADMGEFDFDDDEDDEDDEEGSIDLEDDDEPKKKKARND